tara:strand:- start:345396 stop:346292 length:897 start_codon:yes stop_codon:yes gene_type:complete
MARVLLVEDSRTQAAEITMLLENGSHDVCHAENGRLGQEMLENDAFDVVVTDLEMPEMNGLQLVEAMQLDFAHVPAILVTSRGSEQLATEALRKGAASYVPKDSLPTLLNDAITDVLGVIRGDSSYAKLISTLRKNVFEFELDNDGELISPLVGLMLQVVSGMGTVGGMQLVRLGVAIEHSLLNAMYRGNLELSREETPSDNAIVYDDATNDAIVSRRSESPYCDRKVMFEATATSDEVRIMIRDQGPGFDTSIVPAPGDPDSMDTEKGRGLRLMSSFVDELRFNDKGNEVTMIKRRV